MALPILRNHSNIEVLPYNPQQLSPFLLEARNYTSNARWLETDWYKLSQSFAMIILWNGY